MSNPVKVSDLFDPLGPGTQDLQDFTAAVQGLSRNYKNFAKNLDADSERVKAALAAVQTQGATILAQANGLNLLNEQERQSIAALTTQVQGLLREQARLQEVQAAQARAQERVKDATTQAQSALRAMQNELREAYAAKDTARIEAAAKSIAGYKNETLDLSRAVRGASSELTAARGSYNALELENRRLITTLKNLQDGLGGGSAEAAKLEQQIAANTQTLKDFDAKILVFNRNVGNYKGGFTDLVQELAKARAAQAGLAQGSQEYNGNLVKVSGFQTAAQRSAAQMGLTYEQAEAKIEQVTAAIQPLTTSLLRLEKEQEAVAVSAGKESEAYQRIGFQIESTKKDIADITTATATAGDQTSGFTQQLGFTKAGLQQYAVGLAAGTIGVQALVQASRELFADNVQYSRELAEVRKTTGLTADESERLAGSLKQLNTPTTLAGLLKIAEVGGQLGEKGVESVEAFTKAIDIASQALSNDFTGGAEEIATVLGKISNVFRKELGDDTAHNILAVGSAVNQLGADGAATAPFLTDVALRVGAISASTGVGLKNVLAYAAVLQETGSTSEVAGTALNRFFSTLTTKTKEAYAIAKLANPALTLKDFTHLVNTDFNQAIQVFLAGLREGGKSTTDQARLLATLKLQSGEAKNAIITLSQNTQLFAERQQTANDQLRDATSLAAEAAVNVDTLGGSVDQATNDFKNFFTSGAAAGFLKFLVDATRYLYKNTIGQAVRDIGDAVSYAKEKMSLAAPPLTNYTDKTVAATLATIQQVASQEQLYNAYARLRDTTQRSAAQEAEYSTLRQKLVQEFGTAEEKAVLDSIARRKEQVENTKNTLRQEIAAFTSGVDEAQLKFARAQDAISVQLAGKSAEQLASIRAAAKAQAESGNRRAVDGNTGALIPQAQINAANRLNQAEEALKNQQLLRSQAVAALAKLEGTNTQAKQAGADAAEDEADAEAQLDRTAQERAKNRVRALQQDLAANQRRIEDVRKYQAAQGQLFADRQLSSQAFASSVLGSEELVTQYERDGAALRITLAKAESQEKLVAAENDRARQRQKKNITQAELTDIDGQYAQRRIGIARDEKAAISKIYEDLQAKLEVKPLEFKVAGLNANTLKPVVDNITNGAENAEKAFQRSLVAIQGAATRQETEATLARANGEISEQTYQDRLLAIKREASGKTLALLQASHKATGDEENANAKLRLQQDQALVAKRLAIIEKAGAYAQELESAYATIKGNQIDAQIQRTQAAYDNETKAAGNNAELKAQIDKKYQKQLAKLNYDKAKAEQDAALTSIAISTAVGIAKAFAEYVFPYALIPAGIAAVQGALQAAVVLSKPLPAYFKGRAGGPAEFAQLGERGPELVGQPGRLRLVEKPSIGYLAAGDRVYTAPETRTIFTNNELVEGRLVHRAQQMDLERATSQLRRNAVQQQQALLQVQRADTQALLQKLEQVRRAVESQEQLRAAEGELQRWQRSGDSWQRHLNKRYKNK